LALVPNHSKKPPDLDCWSPAAPAARAVAAERWEVGELQPVQPFRPRVDIDIPARAEPYVCPPLRLSDCPRCGSRPGARCAGIDRDDEVHWERLVRCMSRWNEAS
jgi:hypothetical protein